MAKFTYIVKESDRELSIKELLSRNFSFSSRFMTKLKQNRLIFLNGESMPGWILPNPGDVITVVTPEETSDFPPEAIPISIVYEDDDLLVINKQPGIVVHPTKGKPCHTIANGLMKRMLDKGESYKIRFVNRLDMNTSGLLIVAKNSYAQDNLTKQMKTDHIQKKYMAIVNGVMVQDRGTIDLPLGRPDPNEVERWVVPVEEGGYPSVTHFKVLKRFKKNTLVELQLETGRTHQIRIHLAYIGHPIEGDHLYCHGDPFEYRRIHGDPRPSLDGSPGPRMETNPEIVSDIINRQALHAFSLTFKHPVTGERLHLEAPLPDDMKRALAYLEAR